MSYKKVIWFPGNEAEKLAKENNLALLEVAKQLAGKIGGEVILFAERPIVIGNNMAESLYNTIFVKNKQKTKEESNKKD